MSSPSPIYYHVTNTVTVATLATNIPITDLTYDDKCCYDPTKYTAWTKKFLNPNSTLIAFSSGNVTAMGAESRYNSLNRILDAVEKTGTITISVKHTNTVCTCNFQTSVDLLELYKQNPDTCSYDPYLFPCCTVTFPNSGVKVNVFKSGRAVLSGGSCSRTISDRLRDVASMINSSLRR